MIAEGDIVVSRYTATATDSVGYMGMPPTGKATRTSAMQMFRFSNGKIVESWAARDDLENTPPTRTHDATGWSSEALRIPHAPWSLDTEPQVSHQREQSAHSKPDASRSKCGRTREWGRHSGETPLKPQPRELDRDTLKREEFTRKSLVSERLIFVWQTALTRLSGSLRFGESNWSVGCIEGKSGPQPQQYVGCCAHG